MTPNGTASAVFLRYSHAANRAILREPASSQVAEASAPTRTVQHERQPRIRGWMSSWKRLIQAGTRYVPWQRRRTRKPLRIVRPVPGVSGTLPTPCQRHAADPPRRNSLDQRRPHGGATPTKTASSVVPLKGGITVGFAAGIECAALSVRCLIRSPPKCFARFGALVLPVMHRRGPPFCPSESRRGEWQHHAPRNGIEEWNRLTPSAPQRCTTDERIRCEAASKFPTR